MLADSVAYNVAVGTSERARRPRDQKSVTNPERYLIEVYQRLDRPETDFSHVFGDLEGFMFTLTGKHARVMEPTSEGNELTVIRQRGWRYPAEDTRAAEYLIREAQAQRDGYFSVHLLRTGQSRTAPNALSVVYSLWLDEDGGHYPEIGPRPTLIVHSSATRRHLYWQLTHPVSAGWAVEMNRRIATWAEGDVGSATLARVLRPPGTANFKRYPVIDLVTGELTDAGAWDPEVLDQAVPLLPNEARPSFAAGPYDGPPVTIEKYLDEVEVIGEVADGLGRKWRIRCPWFKEHSFADASGTYLGVRDSGGAWFYCNHRHCQHRTWQEFREQVQPPRRIRLVPTPTTRRKVETRYD